MRAEGIIPVRHVRRGYPHAVCLLALLVLLAGCNYARMHDDDAVNPQQAVMPKTPEKTIPALGSAVNVVREMNPEELKNPLPASSEVIADGAQRYRYYCIQCHGPSAEGYGTVGQSFAPLPTNLKSPEVQEQSDGMLFQKISLGWLRHPPLYDTLSETERWAVVRYMRALSQP